MKPINAMKTCGFWASGTTEKLKKDAQTKAADAIQAMSMVYMTQSEALRQH